MQSTNNHPNLAEFNSCCDENGHNRKSRSSEKRVCYRTRNNLPAGSSSPDCGQSKDSTCQCKELRLAEGMVVEGLIGLSKDPNRYFYSYLSYLSSGGSSSTWMIQRNTLNVATRPELYALKVTSLRRFNPDSRSRLTSEIECLRSLNHFACIKLVNFFQSKHYLFLVMEYCDAGDLKYQIESSYFSMMQPQNSFSSSAASPCLEERTILFTLLQLVLGLHYLHTRCNILHRDLKPANILTTTNGLVKIGDFGLSHQYEALHGDVAQTICGTPSYMAPELWHSAHYGTPVDIWSLGVVLHECMTGRKPFEAKSISKLKHLVTFDHSPHDIPPGVYNDDLVQMVRWMLQKDPARRPTIRELLNSRPLKKALREFPLILQASGISDRMVASIIFDIRAQLNLPPTFPVNCSIRLEGEVEKYHPSCYEKYHLLLSNGQLTLTKKSEELSTIGLPNQQEQIRQLTQNDSAHLPFHWSKEKKKNFQWVINLSIIENVTSCNGDHFALKASDEWLFFRAPNAELWERTLWHALGWTALVENCDIHSPVLQSSFAKLINQ